MADDNEESRGLSAKRSQQREFVDETAVEVNEDGGSTREPFRLRRGTRGKWIIRVLAGNRRKRLPRGVEMVASQTCRILGLARLHRQIINRLSFPTGTRVSRLEAVQFLWIPREIRDARFRLCFNSLPSFVERHLGSDGSRRSLEDVSLKHLAVSTFKRYVVNPKQSR